MVSVTVVVWVIDPLVPVIVTVNVPLESPLEPVKVRVEMPLPPDVTAIALGLKLSPTPVTAVADRDTVPANPLRLVTVMVVDVEPSLDIRTLKGEALMLKSGAAGAVTVKA